MKKASALFLAFILSLSLMATGTNGVKAQESDPTPTPVVTLSPVDSKIPRIPKFPVEPQDDPGDPGKPRPDYA